MKPSPHNTQIRNMFTDIPENLDHEWVEELKKSGQIRIERIVSRGQCSPENFWYDQDEDEWVVLLAGNAIIDLQGQSKVKLGVGDTLHLPAHTKHRVEWTDPQRVTIWLAVFWKS